MADAPSDTAIDPRLRDYLAAEFRQAEADFPRLPLPANRRPRTIAPLAVLLAATVVVLLVVVAGPRTAITSPSGTISVPPNGSASPATTATPQASVGTGFRGLPVDPNLTPVSADDPEVSAALDQCIRREQRSMVAGMARLPANEVRRFMLTNGKEPELQSDELVWAVQIEGDLFVRKWTIVDPMCVVIRGTPVVFAPYGNQGESFSPLPGFVWPEAALPPLLASSASASPAVSPSPSPAITDTSGPEAGRSLSVATLPPGETTGDARAEGMLGGGVTSGTPCFWLSSPALGARIALVWPSGLSASRDSLALLGPDGQVLAAPGDNVVLGGGSPPGRHRPGARRGPVRARLRLPRLRRGLAQRDPCQPWRGFAPARDPRRRDDRRVPVRLPAPADARDVGRPPAAARRGRDRPRGRLACGLRGEGG